MNFVGMVSPSFRRDTYEKILLYRIQILQNPLMNPMFPQASFGYLRLIPRRMLCFTNLYYAGTVLGPEQSVPEQPNGALLFPRSCPDLNTALLEGHPAATCPQFRHARQLTWRCPVSRQRLQRYASGYKILSTERFQRLDVDWPNQRRSKTN